MKGSFMTQRGAAAAIQRKRILVADDDKSVRDLIELILTEDGFEVIACPDGRSAIAYLTMARESGKLPSIILLDLNMPGIDGWGVSTWLSADAVLDPIPVIVISATEAHGRAAKSLNCDAYIVKPFTGDEILGIVTLFSMFT
jgi:CheY-like chemotaxis protein